MEQTLRLVKRLGMARPKDAVPFSIKPFHFRRLLHLDKLPQLARSIYRLRQNEPSTCPLNLLAKAAKRMPHATVWLLTTLRFHGLAKRNPPEVWLAIDCKARRLPIKGMTVRFVWFSGAALGEGVEEQSVEGVPVWIATRTETVAYCFKYRAKIGLDVALQALGEWIQQHRRPKAKLVKCAKFCRMTSMMHPYLEALA